MSRSTLCRGSSAGRSGAVRRPGVHLATTRQLSIIGLVFALFVGLSTQQRDPVKNFCRRFGHQTAVVDDKLFIDGGLVNWNPISSAPDNYTNTWLLYQDLKTVAGTGMPQLQANLSKNASIPSVHGGALWADDVNKRLYLFGGEFQDEPPSPFDLFSYDVLNDHWDDLGAPRGDEIRRPSYGASTSVSSRGEGYYYGGWLGNASVPGWGDTPPVATSQMVKYTMDTGEWTNTTGPDSVRRAEGGMVFIPAGDAGMLVYFGGVRDEAQNGTDGAVGQRMDEILLYDVLSGKWYSQNATGQTPERRRRFCTDVTWADDQSSYNIYVYGGAAPYDEEGAGFDDLYILSLPTFTWIKMYPNTTKTGDYPHHSLSCNMAPGKAQMLIIGGHFPLIDDCDAPEQWGTHNADLGRQNNNSSPWALYEPDKTRYAVPSDVIDVIGGDGAGGATKTAPEGGFGHQDLTALMTRKANIAVRTPTRDVGGGLGSDDSPTLSTGAIVGIAVGGGVVLIALLAGCIFCLRRQRRRKAAQRHASQQQGPFLPPGHPYHNSVSEAGWSPAQTSALASSPSPYFHAAPDHDARACSVPPYTGPPVELPSDGAPVSPQQHGYFADGTGTGSSSQSHARTVGGDSEEGAASPKVGNGGWVPQVSMVQVYPHQPRNYTHQQQQRGGNWPPAQYQGQRQYSPATTPRSERPGRDTRAFSELSAERLQGGEGSPRHETYYHP